MRFRFDLDDDALSTIHRSMDGVRWNEIANHESVRPFLGGDGPLELSAIVEAPTNFAFATPNGGYILWALGSGRYDVHSLFLPDGRGEEARRAMQQVETFMFSRTDCTEGRTTIAEDNRAAKALALDGGFEKRFELQRMPWSEGVTKRAEFFALTLERWALTAEQTRRVGQWFHDCLSCVKGETGSTLEIHEDEFVHTRMAGAAALLIHGGQVEKAVAFYNMWALATHYQPITLLSKRPAVIDVGDAIIQANPTNLEIVQCR